MNVLETYYTYAKLSQAAYIDLSPSMIGTDNPFSNVRIAKAADDQERVPKTLAENIFGVGASNTDPWTMLSPYYKTGGITGHSDPASGFAGMLLSNPTYGKILAIAGTEPTSGSGTQLFQDLMFSDVGQIGFLGAAFNQLVSLFNYVQELKAAASATNVLRLEVMEGSAPTSPVGTFVSSGGTFYSLVAHYDGQGRGLIGAGEQLTVTGHSLGGHLAALAVALFPDTFTSAYTFNAPGYNPISSVLQLGGMDGLLDLFKPYGANPLTAESIANRVITLEAEDAIPGDDFEIVSSSLTGTPFSSETYITTEKVTHDIGHMTESLALHAMLAKLDSSMTKERAGSILTAITAKPGKVYEKLLEQLNKLITGNTINLPRTEPSVSVIDGGDFATRNTFFEKYFALQNDSAFQTAAPRKSPVSQRTISPTATRW